MNQLKLQILTLLTCLGLVSTSVATTLISNNFDSAATGVYGPGTTNGTSIPGVTNLTAFSADNNTVFSSVADSGGGDNVLQFTDNNGAAAPFAGISQTFSPLSTGASGENQMSASFTFERLAVSNTSGTSLFSFGTSTSSVSATTSAIQFQMNNQNGVFAYFDGTSFTNSGFTLSTGTEYRFEIFGDFSSDTQDTWSVQIFDGASLEFDSMTLDTRAANLAVDSFVVSIGANSNNNSPEPFAQIDDLVATAIPEPTSTALFGAAGFGLMWLRRRRPPMA